MIYPSQTSLIPVTVALSRFVVDKGLSAFSQNYPYWYLGTTPFRYLIGPVVPMLELILHNLTHVALFNISIYLFIVFNVLGGLGWTLLVYKITKSNISFLFIIFFYLLFPWKYLTGLAQDELSFYIAKNLVPFVLIVMWTYLTKRRIQDLIISSLVIALVFLTHTGILLDLLAGLLAVVLTLAYKNGRLGKFSRKLKRSVIPLGLGFLLATAWYGPGFWVTMAINPGIGGASGIKVIINILNFAKNFVPIVLAVLFVYFKAKFQSRLQVFSYLYLGSFGVLVLFRFLANPAFLMDWSSWFLEVEVGLWLVSVYYINAKKYTFPVIMLIFSIIVSLFFYTALGRPKLVSASIPDGVKSISPLAKIAGGERAFVTGSSVFWLNALYNTSQVRGGRDEVAVDPKWREAAFNFRESKDASKILKSAQQVAISYILLNSSSSSDYYKDFKNSDVWERVGINVWKDSGDSIMRLVYY
jgi:hypothetical protein